MARKDEKSSADEIEITPEMVEVGAHEIARFDNRFEGEEDAARRVYVAMVRARDESYKKRARS